MRILVKFSGFAIALFFASCHSDLPELPSPEEVKGYEYCGYNKDGTSASTSASVDYCKSTYVISVEDCRKIPGFRIYIDAACNEPVPPTWEVQVPK